ncbi:MAG: hypothetical protein Q8873_03230 [Bacillota bacterium]|nr:hypothetical protein [Bacillota bacterium]
MGKNKEKTGNEEENPRSFPGRETLLILWKYKIYILIVLLAVAVVSSVYYYNESKGKATAVLTLNYEESASGLYPNGTRLNMNYVKSDKVLETAVEYAGIKGNVDIKTLKDCITITPAAVKNVSTSSNDYYITTTYNISLSLKKGLRRLNSENLLKMICQAYKDIFYGNYTTNRTILTSEISEVDNIEYYVIADMLETKANQLKRFISMRMDANSNYSNDDSVQNFKTLSQKVDNFLNYDIVKYRAFILQSSIKKNASHYTQVLNYKNLMQNQTYQKNMAMYDANTKGINLYNIMMSAIVMIPTRDDTGDYYMSKTNSEIDYMAKNASSNLTTANDRLKIIEQNTNILKFINMPAWAEGYDQANSMIVSMISTLNSLANDIVATDKVYVEHKMNNYLTISYGTKSFFSRIHIKRVFTICLGVLFVIVCFVYIEQASHRKQKYFEL